MASLLVKDIPFDLLAEVNYAARMGREKQGEFVIRILREAMMNFRGLAPDTAKGLGIERTHAVSPKKAKVDAPEKPAPLEPPTASVMDFEPEPPPAVRKAKPEMPAGLSNTQMQRWLREHR